MSRFAFCIFISVLLLVPLTSINFDAISCGNEISSIAFKTSSVDRSKHPVRATMYYGQDIFECVFTPLIAGGFNVCDLQNSVHCTSDETLGSEARIHLEIGDEAHTTRDTWHLEQIKVIFTDETEIILDEFEAQWREPSTVPKLLMRWDLDTANIDINFALHEEPTTAIATLSSRQNISCPKSVASFEFETTTTTDLIPSAATLKATLFYGYDVFECVFTAADVAASPLITCNSNNGTSCIGDSIISQHRIHLEIDSITTDHSWQSMLDSFKIIYRDSSEALFDGFTAAAGWDLVSPNVDITLNMDTLEAQAANASAQNVTTCYLGRTECSDTSAVIEICPDPSKSVFSIYSTMIVQVYDDSRHSLRCKYNIMQIGKTYVCEKDSHNSIAMSSKYAHPNSEPNSITIDVSEFNELCIQSVQLITNVSRSSNSYVVVRNYGGLTNTNATLLMNNYDHFAVMTEDTTTLLSNAHESNAELVSHCDNVLNVSISRNNGVDNSWTQIGYESDWRIPLYLTITNPTPSTILRFECRDYGSVVGGFIASIRYNGNAYSTSNSNDNLFTFISSSDDINTLQYTSKTAAPWFLSTPEISDDAYWIWNGALGNTMIFEFDFSDLVSKQYDINVIDTDSYSDWNVISDERRRLFLGGVGDAIDSGIDAAKDIGNGIGDAIGCAVGSGCNPSNTYSSHCINPGKTCGVGDTSLQNAMGATQAAAVAKGYGAAGATTCDLVAGIIDGDMESIGSTLVAGSGLAIGYALGGPVGANIGGSFTRGLFGGGGDGMGATRDMIQCVHDEINDQVNGLRSDINWRLQQLSNEFNAKIEELRDEIDALDRYIKSVEERTNVELDLLTQQMHIENIQQEIMGIDDVISEINTQLIYVTNAESDEERYREIENILETTMKQFSGIFRGLPRDGIYAQYLDYFWRAYCQQMIMYLEESVILRFNIWFTWLEMNDMDISEVNDTLPYVQQFRDINGELIREYLQYLPISVDFIDEKYAQQSGPAIFKKLKEIELVFQPKLICQWIELTKTATGSDDYLFLGLFDEYGYHSDELCHEQILVHLLSELHQINSTKYGTFWVPPQRLKASLATTVSLERMSIIDSLYVDSTDESSVNCNNDDSGIMTCIDFEIYRIERSYPNSNDAWQTVTPEAVIYTINGGDPLFFIRNQLSEIRNITASDLESYSISCAPGYGVSGIRIATQTYNLYQHFSAEKILQVVGVKVFCSSLSNHYNTLTDYHITTTSWAKANETDTEAGITWHDWVSCPVGSHVSQWKYHYERFYASKPYAYSMSGFEFIHSIKCEQSMWPIHKQVPSVFINGSYDYNYSYYAYDESESEQAPWMYLGDTIMIEDGSECYLDINHYLSFNGGGTGVFWRCDVEYWNARKWFWETQPRALKTYDALEDRYYYLDIDADTRTVKAGLTPSDYSVIAKSDPNRIEIGEWVLQRADSTLHNYTLSDVGTLNNIAIGSEANVGTMDYLSAYEIGVYHYLEQPRMPLSALITPDLPMEPDVAYDYDYVAPTGWVYLGDTIMMALPDESDVCYLEIGAGVEGEDHALSEYWNELDVFWRCDIQLSEYFNARKWIWETNSAGDHALKTYNDWTDSYYYLRYDANDGEGSEVEENEKNAKVRPNTPDYRIAVEFYGNSSSNNVTRIAMESTTSAKPWVLERDTDFHNYILNNGVSTVRGCEAKFSEDATFNDVNTVRLNHYLEKEH